MDQDLNNDSLRENDTSIKVSIKETKKGNQIEESSLANVKAKLRETNNREKSNKCNQCEYASSEAGNLRRHLKTHTKKNQRYVVSETLPALPQVL